ncbi:MAG: ribonuclease P protein component [Gammaproteobacteria bacterium]|nr:ribonuclease P protein component [Gammaproteobacteria bacterium]
MDSESKRLPRTIKLTQVSDFQRVFKQGCFKSQDKGFVVLAVKNILGCGRLGITVAKKNVASSVARNRIKRLIRESFRHNKNNVKELDIVVIVRRGTDKLDNQTITAALQKHWQRLAQQANGH